MGKHEYLSRSIWVKRIPSDYCKVPGYFYCSNWLARNILMLIGYINMTNEDISNLETDKLSPTISPTSKTQKIICTTKTKINNKSKAVNTKH